MLAEERARLLAQVKARVDAERVHPGRGLRANAVELAHRQPLHESRSHAGRDDEQPVRLAMVGGQLGEELVVGHPGGRGQAGFLPDGGADFLGNGSGGPAVQQGRGHVEAGLVQRQRLDQRRVAGEDGMHLPRHRLIDLEARPDEHQPGAAPPGGDGGHGRMHPKSPRLVAGGRHHAALARAAHGQRHAAQAWVVALLHGSVERIHVDVDDAAWGRGLAGVRRHAGQHRSTVHRR